MGELVTLFPDKTVLRNSEFTIFSRSSFSEFEFDGVFPFWLSELLASTVPRPFSLPFAFTLGIVGLLLLSAEAFIVDLPFYLSERASVGNRCASGFHGELQGLYRRLLYCSFFLLAFGVTVVFRGKQPVPLLLGK